MNKTDTKISGEINIKNKRASFEYEFLEKFIAGIVLMGTEIKSIRLGKINFGDSYCSFFKGELFLHEFHISPYDKGTHFNHEPRRDRKLLLSRKELKKLMAKSEEKGLTIIPTKVFMSKRGFAKVEIALARGKKLHDKRESIKKKDMERDMSRLKY